MKTYQQIAKEFAVANGNLYYEGEARDWRDTSVVKPDGKHLILSKFEFQKRLVKFLLDTCDDMNIADEMYFSVMTIAEVIMAK